MEMAVANSVEANGYTVIGEFLRPCDIASILHAYENSDLPRTRAGIRHALRHPALAELASDPSLLRIASQVLRGPAVPFHATLFDKSRDANWLVVWHQDTALPLRQRTESPGWGPWSIKDGVIYAHAPAIALTKVLALRIHLDESSDENGPLRVLRGTHSLGVLTGAQIEQLAEKSDSTTCTVPAGGVLAMRPLLVHASSKCCVDRARRVLHIEYATSLSLGEGLELARDQETQ